MLHGNELSSVGIDLVPLLALPEVLVLFISYAALEQLLLLGHKDALHTQSALLLLQSSLTEALSVLFLGAPILFAHHFQLFVTFLLANQLVFHLLLVTITCLKELLSFFIGNIRKFLGPLLFKH